MDSDSLSILRPPERAQASRLRPNSFSPRWLPLSPWFAAAFPAMVDPGGAGQAVPIERLCDPQFVDGLDDLTRYGAWAAVRYLVEYTLKYEDLPEHLLAVPVDAGMEAQVRNFLQSRLEPGVTLPKRLSIADAMPYIGKRVLRLLECVPQSRPDSQLPSPAPEARKVIRPPEHMQAEILRWHEAEPVEAKTSLHVKRLKSDTHPESVGDQGRPGRPLTREPNAIPTEQRRRVFVESHERSWPQVRAALSASALITDASGRQVTLQDPRFGLQLLRISMEMQLCGQSLRLLLEEARDRPRALADVIRLVRRLTEAQQMTAEEEVRQLVSALLARRNPHPENGKRRDSMVLPRYGVGGKVLTLQEVGDSLGVTRERPRQLQDLFETRVAEGEVYAPALRRVQEEINQAPMGTLEQLQSRLAPRLGSMAVEGAVDLIGRVMGWPLHGRLVAGQRNGWEKGVTLWARGLEEATVTAALQHAWNMSSLTGGFLVGTVAGMLVESHGTAVSRATVADILNAWSPVRWVDEETGWGWIDGTQAGYVYSEVKKIVAIAQPLSIDVEEIYAGLANWRSARTERVNRYAGMLAPRWVMQHVLEHFAREFSVAQHDNFRLREPVDPRTLLDDGTELSIYDALKSFGGLASWAELKDKLVSEGGMNPVTFGVLLKNRSWVVQPGRGLYAFRGLRPWVLQARLRDGLVRSFPYPNGAAATELDGAGSA